MAAGRMYEPEVAALREVGDDGRVTLRAPAVGLWRGAPAPGAAIAPGAELGELEVLGALIRVRAPDGVHGLVVEVGGDAARARRPVQYGDALVVVDPSATGGAGARLAAGVAGPAVADGELVFRAPSSGRFYSRPAPDEAPFVTAGAQVSTGDTLCILEVMKTFNRIRYGGAGLPERARVVAVVPADGDDLSAGDPIVTLERPGA